MGQAKVVGVGVFERLSKIKTPTLNRVSGFLEVGSGFEPL
jgi:hypothetical protein